MLLLEERSSLQMHFHAVLILALLCKVHSVRPAEDVWCRLQVHLCCNTVPLELCVTLCGGLLFDPHDVGVENLHNGKERVHLDKDELVSSGRHQISKCTKSHGEVLGAVARGLGS